MYNEELIERQLHPMYKGEITGAEVKDLVNMSCGDKLRIFLKIFDGVVVDAAWTGVGCAVSQVSADVLIERIKGKRVEEIRGLKWADEPILAEVKRMPARVKCAELAWTVVESV